MVSDLGDIIGKGSFSTAYRKNKNTVLLHSTDPIKEIMSNGWFPKSNLFPSVEYIDTTENYTVYEMKYYPPVRSLKNSLKPSHYEFYTELRRLYTPISLGNKNMFTWREDFKNIKDPRKRNIMIQAIEACGNYSTNVVFEISPRNVRVSPTGCLVLLDCFFYPEKLKKCS